jgi:hypothetical protein
MPTLRSGKATPAITMMAKKSVKDLKDTELKGKKVVQLRPYQMRMVQEVGCRNVIVKMPTGSGKTLVAAECMRLALQRGSVSLRSLTDFLAIMVIAGVALPLRRVGMVAARAVEAVRREGVGMATPKASCPSMVAARAVEAVRREGVRGPSDGQLALTIGGQSWNWNRPCQQQKPQHTPCMQRTHFLCASHPPIRVLHCLHCRGEKGKPFL